MRSARGGKAPADWPEFLSACRERVVRSGRSGEDAVRSAAVALLEEANAGGLTRAALAGQAVAELAGMGALEPLMRDETLTEILIRGTEPIWVERDGRLHQTAARFAEMEGLRAVIERLVAGTGRRVDDASPMVDARLSDGSRLNVVLPPVAPVPTVSIRRFPRHRLEMEDLVEAGMVAPRTAGFLHAAVLGRASIVVSGATGSGKTTLLGALLGLVPESERIVIAEETAELRVSHPNLATLECRPGGAEGTEEIDLRRLVRNSLRMRPDRIVVGEVRGGEAVEMVQAMNTGHAGCMTTLHANGAADALVRLETLLSLGMPSLSETLAARWIGAAIDLVLHCERGVDGVRRVTEVAALDDRDGRLSVVGLFDGGDAGGTRRLRCLDRMAGHGIVFPARLLEESAA